MIAELIKTLETLKTRPTWNEYYITLAYLIANRSPSLKLKVGAVIVKDKRVISTGYNGFFSNSKSDKPIHRDGHEMNTIHAEQNAITDAAKRGVSVNGSSIYITHHPCIHCTKFIIASGIKHIYYYKNYNNDLLVPEFLEDTDVSIKKLDINQ